MSTQELIQQLAPGTAVIHCGAHFGEEAPLYAARSCPVLWIEASRACEKVLQRQLVPYPSQTYRMAALAAEGGVRRLFHLSNNGAGMSSSFHAFGPAAKQLWPELDLHHIESVAVTTTTLDQLLEAEAGWVATHRPSVLVLDVQGAELEVLAGAAGSLWRFDWILCEVSSAAVYAVGATAETVQKLLGLHGFRLERYMEMRPGHGDGLYRCQSGNAVDLSSFRTGNYQQINQARLDHLASLPLDLKGKTVLELGSGPGDLSDYFLAQECALTSVEGRAELLSVAAARHEARSHSRWSGFCYDVMTNLSPGGCRYDVVFAYGLLYHLADPEGFLNCVAALKPELFLLETCVTSEFSAAEPIGLIAENAMVASQAIHGQGCRPSRLWLWRALNDRFKFLYACRSQPNHPEFPLNWSSDTTGNERSRTILVASSRLLDAGTELLSELPKLHTCNQLKANYRKARSGEHSIGASTDGPGSALEAF